MDDTLSAAVGRLRETAYRDEALAVTARTADLRLILSALADWKSLCRTVEIDRDAVFAALAHLEAEGRGLLDLIRECRLADGHAARTGDETRWDRAFHALTCAESKARVALTNKTEE